MIAERRDLCPRAPTDRDAVLEALRRYEAVHSLDLRELHYTGNPSQRIRELRDRGFVISAETAHRGGRNGTLYRLIAEPEPTSGVGVVATSDQSPSPASSFAGDGPAAASAPADFGRRPSARRADNPRSSGPDPGGGLFNPASCDPPPRSAIAGEWDE